VIVLAASHCSWPV